MCLVLGLMMASLLDAVLTLGHLAQDGKEANPLMALALVCSAG